MPITNGSFPRIINTKQAISIIQTIMKPLSGSANETDEGMSWNCLSCVAMKG